LKATVEELESVSLNIFLSNHIEWMRRNYSESSHSKCPSEGVINSKLWKILKKGNVNSWK
jgi:hypothetical protein